MTVLPLMKSRPTGGIEALGRVLEGRGGELAKGYAADDANALAVEDTAPKHPPIICPTCGKVAGPKTIRRHMAATGHGERPQPHRVPNEQVAASPEGDYSEPMSKAVDDSRITAMTPEKRHTVVAVTPDEFGTDPQTFQEKMWKAMDPQTPKLITDDDGTVLGTVVEYTQWPFDTQPDALVKRGGKLHQVKLPKDSFYLGVQWRPKAWAALQAGTFSPTATVREALTK